MVSRFKQGVPRSEAVAFVGDYIARGILIRPSRRCAFVGWYRVVKNLRPTGRLSVTFFLPALHARRRTHNVARIRRIISSPRAGNRRGMKEAC